MPSQPLKAYFTNKMKNGTRPTRKDHRDYSLQRTFGSPLKSQIPAEFNFDAGLTNPNQDADGFPLGCTAYTSSELAQDTDKKKYLPKYTYGKTCEIEGIGSDSPQYEKMACGIPDSLKSTIVYGLDDGFGADPLRNRRGAYYEVLNGATGDHFDAVVSAMWDQQRSVCVGTQWQYEWFNTSQGIITSLYVPRSESPWHCFKICGVKVIQGVSYLIAKPWIGVQFGDRGFCYFPREVVNKMLSINGSCAYTLAPYTGQIQTVKLNIITTLISYLRMCLNKLNSMTPISAPVPEAPKPQPAAVVESSLLWDTPANVRHSVRVLCDNANLPLADKNIVCAVIQAESGFNNAAVNSNKNSKGTVTSRDWGVCQINDFFHIGPKSDFPSVDYVLAHPQEVVEWMIGLYKKGKINLWSAYNDGRYKAYL